MAGSVGSGGNLSIIYATWAVTSPAGLALLFIDTSVENLLDTREKLRYITHKVYKRCLLKLALSLFVTMQR